MYRVIGVTELQRRFRAVFDEVAHQHIPYVLNRGSRPEAVLIPYEDFLRLDKLKEDERALSRFDTMRAELAERNAQFSDEEIADDVDAAIAEVRAERRGDG